MTADRVLLAVILIALVLAVIAISSSWSMQSIQLQSQPVSTSTSNSTFRFISFYTERYSDKALRLRQSIQSLGLEDSLSIWKVPCVHSSISLKGERRCVQHTKPKFILHHMRLHPHIGSFVYLDCDMVVRRRPQLPLDGQTNFLYNWNAINNLPLATSVIGSAQKLLATGCVQIYANTTETRQFLTKWHALLEAHPTVEDDVLLDFCHNTVMNVPRMKSLPVEYLYMTHHPRQNKSQVKQQDIVFEHVDPFSSQSEREHSEDTRKAIGIT